LHAQVLDLSQQPLLQQPGALQPLSALPQLASLRMSLTGSALHLPHSSWASLAKLTGLKQLDVSGCALCYLDGGCYEGCCSSEQACRSCSSKVDDTIEAGGQLIQQLLQESSQCQCRQQQQQQQQQATAAAAGQLKLVAAPLELLSSLQQLQRLALADWHVPPSAAGEFC
jgi:hypothetical protein